MSNSRLLADTIERRLEFASACDRSVIDATVTTWLEKQSTGPMYEMAIDGVL